MRGDAGSVKVTTKSGTLSIERATAVDARGASGRVDVGACAGDCHVVFASSNVHIGEAGRAMVATVSGNIDVDAVDDAEVKTVSGNISLGARGGGRLRRPVDLGHGRRSRCPTGSRPATRLKAVSGRVRCDCEPGRRRRDPGRERERGDLGHMPVTTVSGTIVFTDIVGFTAAHRRARRRSSRSTLLERQEELVRARAARRARGS